MLLSEVKVGQEAVVIRLNVKDKKTRRHLLDMGVTRGVRVKVKKIAPMGDPVDIELRNYQLCVSKSELSKVEVELKR